VPVRLGAVVAEAAQDIDAHLFRLAVVRVRLEEFQQARDHVQAAPGDFDEPGLVVDPGGHHVHVAPMHGLLGAEQPLAPGPALDDARDLPVRALHAVAEADRGHAAVLIAGPGVHGHGVGVVEQEGVGLGDRADVAADV